MKEQTARGPALAVWAGTISAKGRPPVIIPRLGTGAPGRVVRPRTFLARRRQAGGQSAQCVPSLLESATGEASAGCASNRLTPVCMSSTPVAAGAIISR